jgi:hypothetical protein
MKTHRIATPVLVFTALILAACGGIPDMAISRPTPSPTPEAVALTIPENPDAPDNSAATAITVQDAAPERSAPEPASSPINAGGNALISISHDQRRVAVIQRSANCVYRIETMSLVWCTPAQDISAGLAAPPLWSPDDKLIASFAFTDVTIWDAITGRIRTISISPGANRGSFINHLSWGGCTSRLLVSFSSGSVGLLDLTTNKYAGFVDVSAHDVFGTESSGCDAPLVSLDRQGSLFFSDPATGRSQYRLEGATSFPSWNPDMSAFAIGTEDGIAIVTPGDEPPQVRMLSRTPGAVTLAAWSPDGDTIVSVTGNEVTLWEAATGEPDYRLLAQSDNPWPVFSPDGSTLALIDRNSRLTLWDVSRGVLLNVGENVHDIYFSTSIPGQALLYAADSLNLVNLH